VSPEEVKTTTFTNSRTLLDRTNTTKSLEREPADGVMHFHVLGFLNTYMYIYYKMSKRLSSARVGRQIRLTNTVCSRSGIDYGNTYRFYGERTKPD
jgi:hypothetical protein